MKKIFLLFIAIGLINSVFAQNTFEAIIRDSETSEALMGAIMSLQGSEVKAMADSSGRIALKNIPDGRQTFSFTHIGYETYALSLDFPLKSPKIPIILLKMLEEELEEVIVSSTRSSRTIADIPTRVEAISGEELDEKGNMKPGDIRMMLNESTGIQSQQTSATSANSSIRIQGLNGRYTQIVRDGFPLYSGFSGGLGLLQIAPLDLKQIEVIKGSASTLYGGGAIAGLVNLISKTPKAEREFNVLLNGTSALGLDASAFYAQQFEKMGTSVFVSYNHGTPYDPAQTNLTAIPQFNRYTFNPKLFFNLNNKTKANFGINAIYEDRTGGDIRYEKGEGDASAYFEKNKTKRYSTQLALQHTSNGNAILDFKNSLSYYDRAIQIPDFMFSGVQVSSYSELNLNYKTKQSEWISGLNFLSDRFKQEPYNNVIPVNYQQNTLGAFVQNTWNASPLFTLETGLRSDYQSDYGFFLLPRFSALFQISPKLSSRIGGGLGYKSPNVFTEDSERIQFRNVLPIDVANRQAERSFGGNWDINYRTTLFNDQLGLSINQLFFYTRINQPLVLSPVMNENYEFLQPEGYINTAGLETNIKLSYRDFKLFIGYTLADVKSHVASNSTPMPLVAKHRLNQVLMYEVEDEWKVGLEAYYYSPQNLSEGSLGKAYWIGGLMIEKLWESFSLFANFENLTDTRQTRFGSIYTGTLSNPVFKDIYAPLDGFVFNGGLKLKL